jgi:hypothetical protein
MDSNYLLQVDYHEHRTDHPDYRHPYSSTYSHDDPQFWPYAYPTQSTQYPRYISSQCDPQPEVAAPPFVYDQSAQPVDDFAAPTRLGIFDISAMHAPVGSAEPWGPRSEGQCHSFVSPSPFLSSQSLTTSAHASRIQWILITKSSYLKTVSLKRIHITLFPYHPLLGFIHPRTRTLPLPRAIRHRLASRTMLPLLSPLLPRRNFCQPTPSWMPAPKTPLKTWLSPPLKAPLRRVAHRLRAVGPVHVPVARSSRYAHSSIEFSSSGR